MDSFLLATKLQIPPQPQYVVHRARLIDALESGVPHYKLIQVSAPAGSGKTTLLAQWAHASRFPIAWLSISREDNDVERFLRYLFSAWEAVQPDISESPLGLLLSSMSPAHEAVLSAFINLGNSTDHMIFVLDDYHLIEEPSIHQALTFLLDHLPPMLHFVLAVRARPPLPLARYRAHQELLEFHGPDLHFLQEETTEFLNHQMQLHLSNDEVVTLHTQLEGWIAGLQLVALTLRHGREVVDKLVVSGRHRFIADYLREDVFVPLSAPLRHFLLQTSILDRMTGSLCDAVTGREDGQEMLETLERENVFLVPLDVSRQWFRFHSLFADFLREELHRHHRASIASLHRRAARWYLTQNLQEQALGYAIAGEDAELVMQIGEHYFEVLLLSGEFNVLRRWLDSLPRRWHVDYPLIGFFRAGVLLFTGALDAGARCIDEVERLLTAAEREDKRWQLARATAIRCTIACFQNDLAQAEDYADKALQDLPEEDHTFRASIYHALGDTYRRNGFWKKARACYLKTLELVHEPAYRIRSVHAFGALADLALRQGRLHSAAHYWRKALTVMREPEIRGSIPLPLIGWVHIRMGEILYEWNELAEVWHYLSGGLSRAELGGDVQAMIAGYLLASRAKLTGGDIEAAVEYLERARPLVEGARFPEWTSHFQRRQLELFLAQERLRAALHWADEVLPGETGEGRAESETIQLVLARVLIVKGDGLSTERALALLERSLKAVDAQGRMGITIEALTLLALAHERRGERVSALTALERALRLAEPEGYLRLFADFGLPLIRLLQEARSRDVMPDYITNLLAACGTVLASAAPSQQTLPEPLTPREQQILRLVATGLTNREIAEKLVVSPETVKKHTGAIYAKLGVHSRTEAASRARALNLLI